MLGERKVGGVRAVVLAVLVTAGLAALSRPAEPAEPYEVTGVAVDVTAADAVTARDQAYLEGQRKALDQLLEQLVGAEKAATIGRPSDDELSSMVQDLAVESEQVSSVRYIGVLTYRFAAAPVDALIGKPSEEAMMGATALTPPSGPVRGMTVNVPITSLQEWVQIQRRLQSVPVLHRIGVRYVARDGGMLDLSYSGDETSLTQALAQRQLSLSQVNEAWVLQLVGAPTGAASIVNP